MTRRKGLHIRGISGLNNKQVPEALVNFEQEVSALVEGINVDITDRGNLRRRKGFSLVASGICHSLWTTNDNAKCFVVQDGTLSQVASDYTMTPLVAVGELPVAYADVNHEVYFTNGQIIGTIEGGSATLLDKAGIYSHPTRNAIDLAEDEDFYDAPPPGTDLCYWAGRLWVVVDGVVWYSKPFFPRRFDFRQDFIPVEDVVFIRGIDSGAFLATAENVVFLSGRDPKAFTVREVCNHGAVPGTAIVVDGGRLNIEGVSGPCVLWESKTHGKMLGTASGQVQYLTEERFSIPAGTTGTSLVREQDGVTQHITVFPNKGEQAQNFYASDVAEAEIRRNGVIIT